MYLKRSFAAGVYLYGTLSLPHYTLYTYMYLFTQGRRERGREKVSGATVQKAGSKIPT